MLYICVPVLYYHGNIHVTEGVYAGGRDFPLSQRSFLFGYHFMYNIKANGLVHFTIFKESRVRDLHSWHLALY